MLGDEEWEWGGTEERIKKECRNFEGDGYVHSFDYGDGFTGAYICKTYQTANYKYVNYTSVKRRKEEKKKGKEERKGRKEAGKRSRDGEWLSHADCRALGNGLHKLQLRRPQDNQAAKLPWILREPQVSPNKNQQSDLLFFLRFLSPSLSHVYVQFSQISKTNFHTI